MAQRPTIRIAGREEPIFADPDQTILEACLSAGVPMPYNCRSGECAECRADLLEGETAESPGADPAVFTDADRARGRILTCLCRPVGNIAVQIVLRDGVAAPKIERLDARVARVERVCQSVIQIEVESESPVAYRAGQYFEWVLPGISPNRNFSAATMRGGERLVFDVRLYPGGKVSEYVHNRLAPGDRFGIVGPYGHFGFTGNAHRPALCIAGGTGLAPIKAMIEQELADRTGRRITLLYGARGQDDLYDLAILDRWACTDQGFAYWIALSDEPAETDWGGARGLVTSLLEETIFDGFGIEAYLCGPPPMIDAAIPALETIGVAAEDIHADRFSPAKNP